VPAELIELVSVAQHISRATDGAYDVTVGPLVSAWGYGPAGGGGVQPSAADLSALRERVGWEKLRIGEDRKSLQKTHPDLSLDLGSLLQGYAVDRLCGILDGAGCEDYLVEVGGELRARGTWRVAIENPADAQRPLQLLDLHDEALATSGLARARKRLSGSAVSHIISPLTGRPVEPSIEVSAVARPTCVEADAWSTAVIAAGLPMAEKVTREHGLKAWVQETTGAFRKLE
jgi:thiamine biosynthesis lipoprotein